MPRLQFPDQGSSQLSLSLLVPRLETEVNKWDDSRNDVIVIAKEMCMMMMDMTDFTR